MQLVERDREAVLLYHACMTAHELPGRFDPAGVCNDTNFLDHVVDIVSNTELLGFRMKPFLQLGVVGGDPGWAGVFIALQRLDASQREHEAACGCDEISANAECPGNIGRVDKFAGGDHLDPVAQSMQIEVVDQHRQALAQRQPHIVDERHRCSSRASVSAIHGDKIRRKLQTHAVNLCKQLIEPGITADHRLETHGFSSHLANMMNHIQQIPVAADIRMAIGTDCVFSCMNAANSGYLRRYLLAGKYAPLAGLCSLAELDFKHFDSFMSGSPLQFLIAEIPLKITHAVFRGADLVDNVAAAFEMIR